MLLRYPLLHRDKAVLNSDLYDILWIYDDGANLESALKTLVSRLRSTLNDCSEVPGSCQYSGPAMPSGPAVKRGASEMREALIAPCGMNCALCVHYHYWKMDLNRKGFRRVCCPGCLPRGEHCLHMGDGCGKLAKGELRFCHLCEAFPCRRLKALDRRYREKYGLSQIENLLSIQNNGIGTFLAGEREKWRCPSCGGTVCCHTGQCMHCSPPQSRRRKPPERKDGPPTGME